jgi:hypothetical protein
LPQGKHHRQVLVGGAGFARAIAPRSALHLCLGQRQAGGRGQRVRAAMLQQRLPERGVAVGRLDEQLRLSALERQGFELAQALRALGVLGR